MANKQRDQDFLVLQTLIQQGNMNLMSPPFKDSVMAKALVEGAQAMLDKWDKLHKRKSEELPHVEQDNAQSWGKYWEVVFTIQEQAIHELAEIYKPRMIECGMQIPEGE